MNPYGHKAMTYYRQNLPTELAKIADPQIHFSSLGEQIQLQVETRTRQIAGAPGSDYLANVATLNMARLMAEEEIFAAMLPGWASSM